MIYANRTFRALAICILALTPVIARAEPAAGSAGRPPDGVLDLDDPVERLAPLHTKTDADADKLRALALFAAARVAEQKQDYVSALRQYERAFRFNPDAVAPLREIVPLAFNLDRQSEGIRYALILADRDPSDPMLLARLAGYLTEEGDTERARALCEKAIALYEKGNVKPAAPQVALWMEMGRLYFLAKEYDKTALYFGKVYNALENPSAFGLDQGMQRALLNKTELAYQLFGESFLEAGKLEQAEAAFNKSNAVKADEALALYNRARLAFKKKDYAESLARLEAYCDKHFASQGTGPYHLLAEVLAQLDHKDELLSRVEKLHEANPDNMPLAYYLAQQYRAAGDLAKAEPIYRSLLEKHKARPPLEAYQGLVELYREQKQLPKLLAIVGDAVARGNSLTPLGDAGKAIVEDTALSKDLIALAQNPAPGTQTSYGSLVAAGLLAIEQEDYAAANSIFESAMRAPGAKQGEIVVTWGLELFLAGQYADAAKVFQRGLDEKLLPENNPTLPFYLAGALEMSGRTDEALAAAKKAAELQKDSPRFAGRAAWIESHAKRYKAAQESYQALVERFEKQHDSPEVREVLHDAKLALSNLCVQTGDMPQSEEWIEQVLDEFPEDFGALNDLGYLWADAGKHLALADRMIRAAIAHEPDNKAFRDSLGWVLFKQGKYAEAVKELKTAAGSEEEPDATILDHLAEALVKAGSQAEAIEAWNRAAATYDKQGEAEKAKQIREKISASAATNKS
ncbi:MAG TPA: tetratricopeptide repeat protein [Pirellulales bacterium]|jgi:tetratricopeptide (TPR) repeat protein|nr:tetratricopeptide repeat protein [Pirellulales bacterium]